MVSINYAFREICCKIVYYGPGLSGKTTNLIYIHKKAPPQTKGELISLATDADRTLYFDFLPLDIGKIQNFSTKFQLYTVPGQVYYNATRKLVLRGVDGLVFVADSQAAKLEENIESMNNLVENLEEYGYVLEELPMIMQYNKRDLEEISSLEELEKVLNPRGLPNFEAVAVKGIGVFDTLKGISKLVLDKARSKSEPKEKKELVSVVAQSEKHAFISDKKEDFEKKPDSELVSVKDTVVEKIEKNSERFDSREEVDEPAESEKAEKVKKPEIIEPLQTVEKIEELKKIEEAEIASTDERKDWAEKEKEEILIQSQAEVMREALEAKKALEQKSLEQPVQINREETKPDFHRKVVVSPMLKRKRSKSAWGGFLWRWFEKITGRR
jgi:signal recognition particle receptor subunit beta